MDISVKKNVTEFLRSLPDKDRRIVGEHIDRLAQHPHVTGDVKRLQTKKPRWRMHVSSKYTLFYTIINDEVIVDLLMTQEKAHKRYGRL